MKASYIKYIIKVILSIPNTVRFNIHYFGIGKMPVFVSYNVKLVKLGEKNSIHCEDKSFFSVLMGLTNGSFEQGRGKKSYFCHEKNSIINIGRNVSFNNNFHLTVHSDSELSIGNNTKFNTNLVISCDKKISIGNNCLFGWNINLLDGDGHYIYNQNKDICNYPKEINIEDNVWAASNVIILKGSNISNNSILASGTVVCKEFKESNVIIGSNPGKIIKNNIFWKKEWIKRNT